MEIKNNYNIWIVILILLSWSSFFLGFYLDENSVGGGSYKGDWKYLWSNLNLFLNNDVLTSIEHENFLTNRPPLSYILHKLLNPFVFSEISFRRSVFCISLIVPILFYYSLKQRFEKGNDLLLILLASTILLSPYFRTSSYWGLEENYGIICLLSSYLFLNLFLKSIKTKTPKTFFYLLFLIFFSSLCAYFDQKLIIVPIICFFKIMRSPIETKIKIFSLCLYFFLSLPYLYLIKIWGGIFPIKLTEYRNLGNNLYFGHIVYATSIIGFYLFPFLFFKTNNLLALIKSFFSNKANYYLISVFLIYAIYLIASTHILGQNQLNIDTQLGKGLTHKISLILFNSIILKEIFIYLAFFISAIIILIYLNKNIEDSLIILYFFLISILIFPFLQEYFDPVILLLAFTFFSTKIFINFKNVFFIILYFSIFLTGANIYYFNVLN